MTRQSLPAPVIRPDRDSEKRSLINPPAFDRIEGGSSRPFSKSLVITPLLQSAMSVLRSIGSIRSVGWNRRHPGMLRPDLRALFVVFAFGTISVSGEVRSVAAGDAYAAAGLAPTDAVAVLRIRAGTEDRDRWSEVILDAIGISAVDMSRNWNSATGITSQLVDHDVECIHAVDSMGGNWLHAVRWNDPVSLERRLQHLGPRALGRGRFRFVERSIDLVIAGPWLVLAPTGSSWLDHAMERARVDDFGSERNKFKTDELPSAPIEVLLRHEAPTGGETLVSLIPCGPGEATLEIAGRYVSSPLPIRPRGNFAARLIPSLQGRVALAVLESGVGVLDPALIQMSADLPALIPAAEVRQSLASRRLLVLDGETIRIPRVGLVDVPAVCVAIPCRDVAGSTAVSVIVCEQAIHEWLANAGLAVQARFSSPPEGVSNQSMSAAPPKGIEIARDGIRHLEFGPEFTSLMGGHPASLAASLNWTIRRIEVDGDCELESSSMNGAWVLVGTSPGIVRRVGDAIQGSKAEGLEDPVCMRGVASPARLGLQFADLAALRARSADQDASEDASVLQELSRFLARLDRVEWSTSLQSNDAVRASVRITMIPDSVDSRVQPVQREQGGHGVEER